MKKILFIPLVVIALIGFITNCDLPDTELHIASGAFMTHVTEVKFIDDTSDGAASKILTDLDGTKSTVNISGPDKEKVYNLEGNKGDGAFTIQGGSLILLLDPNIDFVGEETYTVNLIIEAEGYLRRNVPVTFVKEQNNGFVEVALVKTADIQNNDKVVQAEKSASVDATTGTSVEVVVKADNVDNAERGVTTEIIVPAGTIMEDSDGNPVTGEVKMEVVSFTETEDGTAFFPGGLMPTNINMEDNEDATDREPVSGAFVSAGFTAVNMTNAAGDRVSKFPGKPVTVKMNLGDNTFNPQTNAPYKLGDTVDIWSYETENGQWKFEKTGTVVVDDANGGRLCVMFETTHLSYFNLDYLERGNGGTCWYANMRVNWAGLTRANKVNCRFSFKYVGGGTTSRWSQSIVSKRGEVYDGTTIAIYNAPNRAMEVEVYDLDNSKSLGVFPFGQGEFCSNPTITITEPAPVPEQLISLEFKGLCGSTRVFPPVGTRVFYKVKGTDDTTYKLFHYVGNEEKYDDKITTNKLTVGVEYTFKVYSGGNAATRDLLIDGTSKSITVDIPDSICTALTK